MTAHRSRWFFLVLPVLLLTSVGCPQQGGGEPCLNGALDPGEADVDCGEVCDVLCSEGQACASDADCQNGSCTGSICAPACGACTSSCGDGMISGIELCEPGPSGDLGGATCEGLGFGAGGTLACTTNCVFDTAACVACPTHQSSSRTALGDTWDVAGPPGGHVSALLALEGDVVLAGTGFTRGLAAASPRGYGSALYRSTDGGVTFAVRQRFVNSTVRALVRVGSSQRIYAGVGSLSGANTDSVDDGVWMSDDGGDSWQNVSTGLHPFARVRGLAVAPGTPERVWAVVEGTPTAPINAQTSLYRRDDGGDWVRSPLGGVDQVTGGPALNMAAHLTERDTLYLANGDRLFTSTDGGLGFTQTLFTTFALRWINGLHRSPLDAAHLVLTTHDREMFESLDGGATWTQTGIFTGGQGRVAFDARGVWVATRGGGLQRWSGGAVIDHGLCLGDPEPTVVALAPDDPQRIYLGFHGQGVLHSSDGGAVFTPQSSGLDDLAARLEVTGPASAPVLWALTGGGLHRSGDRGDTWTRIADELGTLAFSSVAEDPADPDHVLAGTNGDWYQGAGPSLGVIELDLTTGSATRSLGLTGRQPGVVAVAFDPAVPGRAFAYQQARLTDDPAQVPSGLFVSQNGGSLFSATPMLGATLVGHIWFTGSPLAMQSDGRLLLGLRLDDGSGNVEVWRTGDGGAGHEVLWSGSSNGPHAGIYVDPADDLFIGGPSPTGLFKSSDDGTTFPEHGDLSGFSAMVRDVAFAPGGGVLVGTVDGAYWAADGQSFVELNEGFAFADPGPEIHSVAILPGEGGGPDIAYAASEYGLFRRRLP